MMAADDTTESQRDLGTQHDLLPLINSRVLAVLEWMLLTHYNLLAHLTEILTAKQQFTDFFHPSYFSLRIANQLVRGLGAHKEGRALHSLHISLPLIEG